MRYQTQMGLPWADERLFWCKVVWDVSWTLMGRGASVDLVHSATMPVLSYLTSPKLLLYPVGAAHLSPEHRFCSIKGLARHSGSQCLLSDFQVLHLLCQEGKPFVPTLGLQAILHHSARRTPIWKRLCLISDSFHLVIGSSATWAAHTLWQTIEASLHLLVRAQGCLKDVDTTEGHASTSGACTQLLLTLLPQRMWPNQLPESRQVPQRAPMFLRFETDEPTAWSTSTASTLASDCWTFFFFCLRLEAASAGRSSQIGSGWSLADCFGSSFVSWKFSVLSHLVIFAKGAPCH